MVADENAKAGAGPAFDAHLIPIGDWATAVWEKWMHEGALERVTTAAKRKIKKATRIWAVSKGVAVAMVDSCQRLEWIVIISIEFLTDQGNTLDLMLDPPEAIKLLKSVNQGEGGRGGMCKCKCRSYRKQAVDQVLSWNPSTRS